MLTIIATRNLAARRLPRLTVAAQRFAHDGSVANSKEFNKRETAIEGDYARKKDLERLQAMKAQIDAHKKELEDMSKQIDSDLEKTRK